MWLINSLFTFFYLDGSAFYILVNKKGKCFAINVAKPEQLWSHLVKEYRVNTVYDGWENMNSYLRPHLINSERLVRCIWKRNLAGNQLITLHCHLGQFSSIKDFKPLITLYQETT